MSRPFGAIAVKITASAVVSAVLIQAYSRSSGYVRGQREKRNSFVKEAGKPPVSALGRT
jgi:hypothetical protein